MWLLAVTTMAAATPSIQTVLDRVQSTYKRAGDIEANFEQVFVDKLRGKRRSEKGILWAKQDGRVRWSYRDPIQKDFIYDGKKAYFYEPANAQVTLFESFEESPLADAVRFLWGQGNISTTFDVKPCEKGCDIGDKGDVVLALWPKEEIPTVDHSLLVVDKKTNRVRRSFVFDPLGNRTEYHFRDITFGAKIADARFAFEVPEGVNLLRSTVGRTK